MKPLKFELFILIPLIFFATIFSVFAETPDQACEATFPLGFVVPSETVIEVEVEFAFKLGKKPRRDALNRFAKKLDDLAIEFSTEGLGMVHARPLETVILREEDQVDIDGQTARHFVKIVGEKSAIEKFFGQKVTVLSQGSLIFSLFPEEFRENGYQIGSISIANRLDPKEFKFD